MVAAGLHRAGDRADRLTAMLAPPPMPAPMPAVRFLSANDENAALSEDIAREVTRCLTHADPLNGEDVAAFEASVAAIAGRRHAVAVGSCTDALFFALTAAGIGSGDEVLVPAFSFIATAAAIMRTGARPVFVDILAPEESNGGAPFTLNLARAEEALTPRTSAMVWVGLFGGLADPVPIEHFARTHKLVLIEDAAQSFGASWEGRHAGGMGLAGAFSFDRHKVLAAPGTGGAVVCDDETIAVRVRALRWHGKGADGEGRLGYNSQLSNVFAAVLNLKLARLPAWLERRREVAAAYDAGLADLPLALPRWPAQVTHARHKYVVLSKHRGALQDHLDARGMPTRRHYDRALPDEPLFARGPMADEFPVARRAADEALSLPIHPFLADRDVEHVVEAVREFFA